MRHRKLLTCGLSIFLLAALQPTAWGQTQIGPFEITGFYQYTINPATEHANPNNSTCFSFIAGPGFTPAPYSCPKALLKKGGKPDFLLMRQLLDVNIFGKFNEDWSVTLQPRLFFDMTKIADNHFRQYESLPTSFPGSGSMLRGGGNDFKAEMSQAYIDYRSGPLWLRIGKQQIAWGEAIALRVLDTVNPLDLSQFLFIDRAFEEFDRIRIPQWFIRADYTIPNLMIPDLTAELILNPGAVTPTILPKQGAPYNLVPAFLRIRNNVNQGEPTAGGRVTGTAGGVQFSANFVTKPNDDAVGVFRGVFPCNIPGICVGLDGKHPRIYIAGGSMNYNWAWAGAILRLETAVTPNAPFLRSIGGTPTRIIKRPVWKSVIAVDRPTYVIPGLDSMTIGFQFFETFTGGRHHNFADSNGAKVDQAVHAPSIFLQQPLFAKRVTLEFLGVFDTDDAHWLQSNIHWEIGSNIRMDLFYNKLGGAEKRPGRLGGLAFSNGPAFRFTYGF